STEGSRTMSGLLPQPEGRFFGIACCAGPFGHGTVYELKSGAHAVKVLHAFEGAPNDGATPVTGVIAGPDGSLWGVSKYGGTDDAGTLFRLGPEGGYGI